PRPRRSSACHFINDQDRPPPVVSSPRGGGWRRGRGVAQGPCGEGSTGMDPKNLRYATTHEWAALQGDICTIGITKFAVEQLTDVVYIELPDVGDHVFKGDSFGEIES